MSEVPRISLVLAGYNQSLLFKRALYWLTRQDFGGPWELIVIDDYGSEDWEHLLEKYYFGSGKLRYFRLEHDMGWRGCNIPHNFAFNKAEGEILTESNPHLLLPSQAIGMLYLAHHSSLATEKAKGRLWVSLRGYTITREDMPHFDTVDWRASLDNLKGLPHWDNPWTRLWEDKDKFYGTHLCCSIPRHVWFDEIAVSEHRGIVNTGPPGFPEFNSYGAGDVWYAGKRREVGLVEANLHTHFFWHQDHYSNQELVKRFNVKSLLNEEGLAEKVAPFFGQGWEPANPDGTWPSPPLPWESYVPGSGELPKLRKEFEHYYDMDWAEDNAPWLAKELQSSPQQ